MASLMMLPSVIKPAPRLFNMRPQTDLASVACNFGFVKSSAGRCSTFFKSGEQDNNFDLAHEELPLTDWNEKTIEIDDDGRQILAGEALSRLINEVKEILNSMGDGEISVSAYDTAWVALLHEINGKGRPQFPASLEWIARNQLDDGSWGDADIFSAHDRIINTLACVIALKSWKLCPEKCQRGLEFLRENLCGIGKEDATLMPIGFEVAFPSLMEKAQNLGLELPYDDTALQGIYQKRDLKLKKIPREVLHQMPTPLLHTLEGLSNLDWNRLLRLQCADGSFLFSPASTAYALEQTEDKRCLQYLERIVKKFNGGVPNVYPVDLFEHLWSVDRLERLGVARHFELEISECMAYVHRYWTEVGICWSRNSDVQDVDDTAMGFRLLRLHGYEVSQGVFKNFEKGDEFFCFLGQSEQAITGIFNLYRASQVMFPGEKILDRAKRFSYRFLREKQAANQLTDKWIIPKDLPGEVGYGLDFPWYASLPRIEARMYLEQYGGNGDAWIGKTLYRMFYVSSDRYLTLAKLDFGYCQSVHQKEWINLQRWYEESGLGAHGVSKKIVLRAYFLAAASIYEPERASERLGWAQSAVIAEAISSYLGIDGGSGDKWQEFVCKFFNEDTWSNPELTCLVGALNEFINRLQSNDHHDLRQAWEGWLQTWRMDQDGTGVLLVRIIEACGGRSCSRDPIAKLAYHRLSKYSLSICHRLSSRATKINNENNGITTDVALDIDMRKLVQCVFWSGSDGLNKLTKQTFFLIVRSYYYAAHCPAAILEEHIKKVLFELVI